jgi:hypothetical protein
MSPSCHDFALPASAVVRRQLGAAGSRRFAVDNPETPT